MILIGWRQFDTISSSFRESGYAYSHDGGQTWTFPGVLEPGVFSSDPVLDFDLDGNIYYYALQSNRGPGPWSCYLYRTSDGGVTWPQEVYAYGGDKAWVTIDRTSGIGTGHIYVAWSPAGGCCGDALFTRSTDGGLTFMTPIALPYQPHWGTLSVGPEGELYIAGTSDYAPNIVIKSTNAQDAGAFPSFGQSVAVDLGGSVRINLDPNPAGLMGQLWIATDHSGGTTHGNVYVLGSVSTEGTDPLDVMFSRSTDGGLTWSPAIRINDDPQHTEAWQWFGTMSVAPNGRIDVIWNDTRNSGVGNLSELYYAFSYDGGSTWSDNVPASPMFDSHVGWPQQNKLGDYYDMISDNEGAKLAWAATFNGEQDVYFLRLTPDCNGNGIADHIDIADGTSSDCNGNGMPDECEPDEDCNDNGKQDICDVADGTSDDVNSNGVPDECECTTETVVPPVGSGVVKNRYLSLVSDNLGLQTALRVTPVVVPNGFEALEGKHFWIGPPDEYCEPSAQARPEDSPWGHCGPNPGPPAPTFLGARLRCTPHYMDWAALGVFHVFDDEIVPGAVYEVQAIIEGCLITFEPNFSDPLYARTSVVWGDLTRNFNGSEWTAPDGGTDFLDITAIVDKFRNLPTSPSKVRADLAEDGPDALIDFRDISFCVEAFRGFAYPFAVPDDCP